jgi:hypothetical protein
MSEPLAIAPKPPANAALVGASVSSSAAAATEPPSSVAPAAPGAPPAAETAPVSLEIGTVIGATLIAPAPGGDPNAVGARFELRFGAAATAPAETNFTGAIALGAGGDTVVETSIGTLALDTRLALTPGTNISFQLSGAGDPGRAALPPSQANGWPALDQALSALDKSAPQLAAQLRAALAPATAPALAATLLFMAGALYSGRWPSLPVLRALGAAGQDRLRARLDDDLAGLRRLGNDGTTGDWRVLTLPLLIGAGVEPLRLYLRRRESGPERDLAGQRFVIEAELSRLGAVQLDGLVRGNRLDLVLRSHTPLPQALRDEATALFRSTSAAAGYFGDIVFAIASSFAVDPLTELRPHVAVQI